MALSCENKSYPIPDYCKGDFRLALSGPGYKSTVTEVSDERTGKKLKHTCYQWECLEYPGYTAAFCQEKEFITQENKVATEILCSEKQSGPNGFGCRAKKVGNKKHGYYLVNFPWQGEPSDEDEPCSRKHNCYEDFGDWRGGLGACPVSFDDPVGGSSGKDPQAKPTTPRTPSQTPTQIPTVDKTCSGCVLSRSRWLCEHCESPSL
jgi:hypothetical protein